MLHYTKFPCSSLVLPLFLSKFAFPLWIPNIGAVHGGSLVLFSWGFELLLLSPNILFDSLPPHEVQHIRLPCPSLSNGVGSKSCPLSWWCHPTILSSVVPFSSRPQSFPGSRSFPASQFFASGGWSIEASASASVLPMNSPDGFPLGLTVWSPFNPRDSQESSPAPQFKSINSSAFTLLCGPTLTSEHDNWKNHSFDSTDLFWQSNVSAI